MLGGDAAAAALVGWEAGEAPRWLLPLPLLPRLLLLRPLHALRFSNIQRPLRIRRVHQPLGRPRGSGHAGGGAGARAGDGAQQPGGLEAQPQPEAQELHDRESSEDQTDGREDQAWHRKAVPEVGWVGMARVELLAPCLDGGGVHGGVAERAEAEQGDEARPVAASDAHAQHAAMMVVCHDASVAGAAVVGIGRPWQGADAARLRKRVRILRTPERRRSRVGDEQPGQAREGAQPTRLDHVHEERAHARLFQSHQPWLERTPAPHGRRECEARDKCGADDALVRAARPHVAGLALVNSGADYLFTGTL